MSSWSELDLELQRWKAAGETPAFWWRDDDAVAPSARLDRLLDLSDRFALPVHLAVVPANLSPDLGARLRAASYVQVIQHGFAHVNNEPSGARASEIGQHRPLQDTLQDLRAGRARLLAADLPGLLPALAPPWNRIGDKVIPHLPGLGFRLLSAMHARQSPEPVPGLAQVNIHFDPIRWKGGASFRGEAGILGGITEHLAQKRMGLADRDEPTGLSTHHLQTWDEVWDFLDLLLERLTRPDAGRWHRLSEFIRGA